MSKSTELRWSPSGHSVSDDHDRPGVAGKTNDPTLRYVSWGADALEPGRDLAPSAPVAPASRGQAALAGTRKTLDVGLAIPQIAASEPERSCAAALSLEDWRTEPNSGQWSSNRLLETPGVSGAADAVGSLQPAPWFEERRGFTTPESPLDVRLLAPDSRASDGPFGGRYLGRLAHLDLPDEISPGSGLILPQNHGTPPPETRIAARATLPAATKLGNPIGKRVDDRSAPASWTLSRMVRQPTFEPFLEGCRQAGDSRPAAALSLDRGLDHGPRSAGRNPSSWLEPPIEESPNFEPSARRALAAICERAKATQPGG